MIDYIHKVEITYTKDEEKGAIGWNDPCGEDYEIKIFLDSFNFRKNSNIEKAAWRINYIFLIELVCAMSRVQGLHDGSTEWCEALCPPMKAVEMMGFYNGWKEK